MLQMKFRNSAGSAIVEFMIFVIFGQLLVFSGALQASEWMDKKLRLELFANHLARAQSLGKERELFAALADDYNLQNVTVTVNECGNSLSCITAQMGDLKAAGVSFIDAQ
ncbi:MAG: hypothetical protein F2529_03640 [Actinobacteria bacterium]|jgi:hypothetical protein|uniref:Unannotated protein n=1 Tax=freshwater metagenome TaxID=449393 RepID=A0A6J6C1B3_9ZZZZ|nr:hypothetical protein [Rhodoluna sp.]MSZ95513.1 hypothetical protein [Actinomycetota bacterium]MTA29976.1 hypothetical protein [Actinomycetota bacterium]